MNDDLRLSYAVLAGITSAEHIDAQRLRTALREQVKAALGTVHVMALPMTAMTAPLYEEADETRAFADPIALDAMCRFAFIGNLTGVPCGTAPVGVDGDGLPIGLQIVGDAWDEHVVLGVLAHLERAGLSRIPRPSAWVDLLG